MQEQSAVYDQVEAAYHTMLAEAKTANDGITYWQGALTNKLVDSGISRAKYSQITSYLKKMGCIERLRRGAGNVPSIWILWHPPTREDFEAVKIHSPNRSDTYEEYKRKQEELQSMKEKIDEIEDRLDKAGI